MTDTVILAPARFVRQAICGSYQADRRLRAQAPAIAVPTLSTPPAFARRLTSSQGLSCRPQTPNIGT